jgi:hypothetical protein
MNESKILDGIRESVKLYYKRNLNMYTRATIINTVFSRKVMDVASVVDFTTTFLKEIDSIIYKFLWRTTEWIV